jgi:hypothetical protein
MILYLGSKTASPLRSDRTGNQDWRFDEDEGGDIKNKNLRDRMSEAKLICTAPAELFTRQIAERGSVIIRIAQKMRGGLSASPICTDREACATVKHTEYYPQQV